MWAGTQPTSSAVYIFTYFHQRRRRKGDCSLRFNDWLNIYECLHEPSFCFATVVDCWMIMKTRSEAASLIHTWRVLHVKLSCHVLARWISINLFLRTGRTKTVNLPTCLNTKQCRSLGNVYVRHHSFYILAPDSSFSLALPLGCNCICQGWPVRWASGPAI